MGTGEGIGERLTRDSLLHMLRYSLDALGWFDEATAGNVLPVQMIDSPLDWDVPIRANLIAIHIDSTTSTPAELGNDEFVEVVESGLITVLSQSESFGVDICGDILDILRGNHPSIGRVRASFQILDMQQPTPPAIGYATISDVSIGRVPTSTKRAWRAHWFEITFTVTRHYGTA